MSKTLQVISSKVKTVLVVLFAIIMFIAGMVAIAHTTVTILALISGETWSTVAQSNSGILYLFSMFVEMPLLSFIFRIKDSMDYAKQEKCTFKEAWKYETAIYKDQLDLNVPYSAPIDHLACFCSEKTDDAKNNFL